MGLDGLVVEEHCAPTRVSDSAQQLSPAELGPRQHAVGGARTGAPPGRLRERIDRTDDESRAAGRRMERARDRRDEAPEGLPVAQTGRYGELLDRLTARAALACTPTCAPLQQLSTGSRTQQIER